MKFLRNFNKKSKISEFFMFRRIIPIYGQFPNVVKNLKIQQAQHVASYQYAFQNKIGQNCLDFSMRFYSGLATLEPQAFVVARTVWTENISGRLLFNSK